MRVLVSKSSLCRVIERRSPVWQTGILTTIPTEIVGWISFPLAFSYSHVPCFFHLHMFKSKDDSATRRKRLCRHINFFAGESNPALQCERLGYLPLYQQLYSGIPTDYHFDLRFCTIISQVLLSSFICLDEKFLWLDEVVCLVQKFLSVAELNHGFKCDRLGFLPLY